MAELCSMTLEKVICVSKGVYHSLERLATLVPYILFSSSSIMQLQPFITFAHMETLSDQHIQSI